MDHAAVMKTIVESVVRLGIRNIQNDSDRGIRYLVDLGAQLSRTRLQQEFYQNVQRLLEKPGSVYRRLISSTVNSVDAKTLEVFGTNLGYMSWTYGARIIRHQESRQGYHSPWTLILDCDCDAEPSVDLSQLVAEGQRSGIYTYMVFAGSHTRDVEQLPALFDAYPDSAFVVFSGSEALSALLTQATQPMQNVITILPLKQPSTAAHIKSLAASKRLFGTYTLYDGTNADSILSGQALRQCGELGCGFMFFIANDACGAQTKQRVRGYVHQCRDKQAYPVFAMDLWSDIDYVDQVISPEAARLRIRCDGAVFTATGLVESVSTLTAPLEHVLRRTMPHSGGKQLGDAQCQPAQ